MKTPLRLLALLAVAALCAAPAPKPPLPAGPSPTIVRQIDALLKHRLQPEPLPVEPPNPFVVTGGGIRDSVVEGGRVRPSLAVENLSASASANPDREAVPANNADILAACAGKLRVGGMIRLKDQIQIVIDNAARKEGDFLTVQWAGAPVHLRIVRLLSDQFVLRYQDAELTLRY